MANWALDQSPLLDSWYEHELTKAIEKWRDSAMHGFMAIQDLSQDWKLNGLA